MRQRILESGHLHVSPAALCVFPTLIFLLMPVSAIHDGVQELLELKQLYEKAAGKPYGPPPSPSKGKGKSTSDSKGDKAQEKHLDTKKASKEAKRVSTWYAPQHQHTYYRHHRHHYRYPHISAG